MPQGEYLQFGGQAIIEGVMMRSPRYFSVACRAPNGEIVLATEELEKTWIGRQKWLKLPFLRGTLAILDSMALGIKALRFSGNVQLDPRYQKVEPNPDGTAVLAAPPSKRVQDATILGTLIGGLAIGFFLFQYLPIAIGQLMAFLGVESDTAKNVVTEVVKLTFFLAYVGLISLLPDIRRTFQYHGAEHKAINVVEADEPLTLENALRQTRLHPRCGTSFIIIVLLIGFVIFTLLPRNPFGLTNNFLITVVRFGLELACLPLIAGLAYELLRWAGRMKNKTLMHVLFWPGLMTQYLTTRVPDPEQTEVARVALLAVLRAEETGELASRPEHVLEPWEKPVPAPAPTTP